MTNYLPKRGDPVDARVSITGQNNPKDLGETAEMKV
jgi:hypothetical protein